jgi:hypothetical protein
MFVYQILIIWLSAYPSNTLKFQVPLILSIIYSFYLKYQL